MKEYLQGAVDVINGVGSTENGLTQAEASKRLEANG